MSVIEKSRILGELICFLREQGIEVSELTDFSDVEAVRVEIGKPYLTPVNSPAHNDFTHNSALWLVARKDGVPIFAGGARLEDLGSEPVSQWWGRVLSRAYGGDGLPVVERVRDDLDPQLGGRMAYFGDLYANQNGRGSLLNLQAFVALGHLAVSLKWDPDMTYCFVRERDVYRGAAVRYGFPSVVPGPITWRDPPSPRCNSEWLAVLPRREVVAMARVARAMTGKSQTTTDAKQSVDLVPLASTTDSSARA